MHTKVFPGQWMLVQCCPLEETFFLNRSKFYAVTISLNLQQTWLLCNSMIWTDIFKTRSAWIETSLFFFFPTLVFLSWEIPLYSQVFFSPTVAQIIYSVTQLKSLAIVGFLTHFYFLNFKHGSSELFPLYATDLSLRYAKY